MISFIKKGAKSFLLIFLLIILASCQNEFIKFTPKGETTTDDSYIGDSSTGDSYWNSRTINGSYLNSHTTWADQKRKGDRAAENKQWSAAAKYYNKALDLIDDPRITPQSPSRYEIEYIMRQAAYASALNKNYTRGITDCSTKMRNSIRGIQINKHLFPVEFVYDSSQFTPKGESSAQIVAKCLHEKQQEGVSNITLVGHTDERGDRDYNYHLSVKRAKAVKKYLIDLGLDINIAIEGKGEDEPVTDPPPGLSKEERYQLDRRVEVLIN